MNRNRGFKYRIYPNGQQQVCIAKTFGCCRFVYNKVLEEQVRLDEEESAHMSKYDSFKWMTASLKNSFPFLKEADSTALMNSVFNLDDAYRDFFKRKAGFPQFKSKRKAGKSYTASAVNGNIHFGEDYIVLPKLGMVKAVIHRLPLEGYCLKSATVSQDSKGDYYCSLLFEYDEEEKHISKTTSYRILGLDYKSDGLYMDSESRCADMPKFYKTSQERLALEQKKLSSKKGAKKGERKSHNYIKQQKKVNRLYVKTANQRRDFLNKLSASIAKMYDFVCVEDLDMQDMASSESIYSLGKPVHDNGFGMFRTMLEYKLEAKGGKLPQSGQVFCLKPDMQYMRIQKY